MYLADTNILLRFLLLNDPAYPAIRQAVRSLKVGLAPAFLTGCLLNARRTSV